MRHRDNEFQISLYSDWCIQCLKFAALNQSYVVFVQIGHCHTRKWIQESKIWLETKYKYFAITLLPNLHRSLAWIFIYCRHKSLVGNLHVALHTLRSDYSLYFVEFWRYRNIFKAKIINHNEIYIVYTESCTIACFWIKDVVD
jgi:hypothetical protein